MPFRLPRLYLWQWALIGLALAGAAVGGFMLLNRVSVHEVVAYVRGWGPVPFFAALAILSSLGAPVSPFYLAAGAAFSLPVAMTGTVIAVLGHLAVTYSLARWLLHPVIARLAARMGYRIPVVRPEDRWQITLLIRITPGPPFFMQSYILGLAGVPLGVYMAVSVPVCSLLALGFVYFGDSLMSGSSGKIVLGVSVVAAALLIVRLLRKMMVRRSAAVAAAASAVATEGHLPES